MICVVLLLHASYFSSSFSKRQQNNQYNYSDNKRKMTNPPKEETPTYRSIGRGGGGNMFKTDPADHSPKLIPVSSAGHALPPDQKKFSISRGGYGNIRDNKPSEVDELGSGSRHGSFHYEEMPVLNSVKSIGRGGFGNQIRNIKSHDSAQKNLEGEESKSFFEKVMKFFK